MFTVSVREFGVSPASVACFSSPVIFILSSSCKSLTASDSERNMRLYWWQCNRKWSALSRCLPPPPQGPVCPSELLEVGPQTGILPPYALRHLPPLLRRLREAVEDTHVYALPTSQIHIDRTHKQVFSTFTAAIVNQKYRQMNFHLITRWLYVSERLPESCIVYLW